MNRSSSSCSDTAVNAGRRSRLILSQSLSLKRTGPCSGSEAAASPGIAALRDVASYGTAVEVPSVGSGCDVPGVDERTVVRSGPEPCSR